MKNIKSKIALGASALLIAAGFVALPLTAQAHSADVVGTAICQSDGNITVQWEVQTYNVPEGEEGEVKVIDASPIPANLWLYEWAEHKANHGLDPLAPNARFNWTQTGIPNTAKTASVTFQIDWHGHSSDPTATIPLPDDCTPPVEPPVEPPTEPEPPVTPPTTPLPPTEPPVTTPTPVAPVPTPVQPDVEPLVATG